MPEPEPQTKLRLPIWAKLLLALFLLGIAGVTGALVTGTAALVNMEQNAHDPKQMPFVARKVVVLQDPLPKGFAYKAAASFLGFITIEISHDSDQSSFYVFRTPLPKDVTAEALAREAAKQAPLGVTPISSVKEEGKSMVAGEPLAYVIGDTKTVVNDEPAMEMVAVAMPKGKKAAVIIFGVNPGQKYNMETTQELLNAIKGFN
jgi:hypothetical protein